MEGGASAEGCRCRLSGNLLDWIAHQTDRLITCSLIRAPVVFGVYRPGPKLPAGSTLRLIADSNSPGPADGDLRHA